MKFLDVRLTPGGRKTCFCIQNLDTIFQATEQHSTKLIWFKRENMKNEFQHKHNHDGRNSKSHSRFEIIWIWRWWLFRILLLRKSYFSKLSIDLNSISNWFLLFDSLKDHSQDWNNNPGKITSFLNIQTFWTCRHSYHNKKFFRSELWLQRDFEIIF